MPNWLANKQSNVLYVRVYKIFRHPVANRSVSTKGPVKQHNMRFSAPIMSSSELITKELRRDDDPEQLPNVDNGLV